MIRLGLENRITKRLTPPEYPWAVGQGALGIEIRKSDTKLQCMLDTVQDLPTRWMALSERALLHALNGGCSSPVAVGTSYIKRETTIHSRSTTSSLEIRLHATIVEPSGARDMSITDCAIVSNDSAAEELGVKVALQLFDAGAKEMLERIKQAGTDAYNAQKETQRAKTLPSHD